MAVLFNENFLIERGGDIYVNPSLPFRIQKRKLLEDLGFPGNPNLYASPVTDVGRVY